VSITVLAFNCNHATYLCCNSQSYFLLWTLRHC